jgi:hypothetical protein
VAAVVPDGGGVAGAVDEGVTVMVFAFEAMDARGASDKGAPQGAVELHAGGVRRERDLERDLCGPAGRPVTRWAG